MKIYTDQELKNHEGLINAVFAEHERQIEKWGIQQHDLFKWLVFTMEELGELADAVAEEEWRGGNKEQIFKEAIQTATLSLKIAEMVMWSKPLTSASPTSNEGTELTFKVPSAKASDRDFCKCGHGKFIGHYDNGSGACIFCDCKKFESPSLN